MLTCGVFIVPNHIDPWHTWSIRIKEEEPCIAGHMAVCARIHDYQVFQNAFEGVKEMKGSSDDHDMLQAAKRGHEGLSSFIGCRGLRVGSIG